MRCYAMLALCASHQATPAPARRGALTSALMHLGIANSVEYYTGTFYGVTARLELDMRTREARVALRGAVLGGAVEGTGRLNDIEAEAGAVVLDRAFEARLRRRFISIRDASLDRAQKTVTVCVTIPVMGTIELVLVQQAR